MTQSMRRKLAQWTTRFTIDCRNEGDLCNLFKLRILSTDIEEIEHSINKIKLKEKMVPTIKRKCS